jgi:phosphoribosyl 1,2-cyclic phosphate phosphodiesterase
LKITVLGSGTSSGLPIIGCPCAVCQSDNPKNKRLRSSCLFEVDGKNIIIDTGTDFRQQALIHNIPYVDAVLYTHDHADHVHGIDDLRPYNVWQKGPIPAFGHPSVIDRLVKKFKYIFAPMEDYPSMVPQLTPMPVEGKFEAAGIPVQMIPCRHGTQMTYNYRIGNAAWLTDTNGIPPESMELLKGLEVLFVDGLRLKPHPTHFHLEETLKAAQAVGAKKTYLIHLTHDYDHDLFNKSLPANVELAYDGLTITI